MVYDNIPPLFMFGFERSGTTLLSMMVGAHPDIAVPLTVTGLWYRYAQRLSRYNDLEKQEDVERLVTDLLAEERIQLWDVEFQASEIVEDLMPANYAAVIERFHQIYALKKGKRLWANIDIATLDEMDVANRWFPHARFLHIVRDGRDVALSHKTMPYGASNIFECAERWTQRLQVNLKMGSVLGPLRYQVIRYEDLITNSEETLERICAFTGVPYSSAMLDYPKMVHRKIPEDRRWLWPALDKAPDKSKVFGWKLKMSRTQRIVFEGTAHQMITALGYEAFEAIPKRASAYVYELWCFLGRRGRFRRFARRLGFARESQLQKRWRKTKTATVRSADIGVNQAHFGALVHSGIYGIDFEHSEAARVFFRDCMAYAFSKIVPGTEVSVLDAGCGPGAWLDYLYTLQSREFIPFTKQLHLYGFDFTSEMVEVARQRMATRVPKENLCKGDILADASYAFGKPERKFQIIYAYDVIQQLPPHYQWRACATLLSHLAPGGIAVIFDHDSESLFGRKMAAKKFMTQYLGINLVPRYYCSARYPRLSRFQKTISMSGTFFANVRIAHDGRKRALIAGLLA